MLGLPSHVGYLALALLVGGEAAGLPIPGETALGAATLLAAAGHLSLVLVIVTAALAAIVGDNIGYWIGRRGGRRVLVSVRGPFQEHRRRALERGERFVTRYGTPAVVIGRFLPVLRVVTAMVAGATRMPAGRFVAANAVGAVLWATATAGLITLLGPVGGAVLVGVGASTALISALVVYVRRRSTMRSALESGG